MTQRQTVLLIAVALLLSTSGGVLEAQIPLTQRSFNESPLRPSGQSVIPVFDGWFQNPDSTYTLCYSYFSLNTVQQLDIPLGPGNYLEPAQFDGVQPTHFDPVPSKYRHYWCVFTVTVPQDFGEGDVTWNLMSEGEVLSVPGGLNPAYILQEFVASDRGAEAPYVRLTQEGPRVRGRKGVWSEPRQATVGQPLSLTLWVEHPSPGTWLGWTKHQGPGAVHFAGTEMTLDEPADAETNTVTFAAPGEYVLRVQAINDVESPGNPTQGFEFHCCWTNVYFRIHVTE